MSQSNASPVRDIDIPLVSHEDSDPIPKGLRVLVDGRPATCFVAEGAFRSDRIFIVYDGEDLDSCFQTKHFYINEPGKLGWGHEGKVMQLQHLLEDKLS